MSEQLRTLPWYDRNPEAKTDAFGAIYGPHVTTERGSYTCPDNKNAMIEVLMVKVMRVTVADTPGLVQAYWTLQAKGGDPKSVVEAAIRTNQVGDKDSHSLGMALTMFPGDKIIANTTDISTGGTAYEFLSFKLTEFDRFPIEAPPFQVELPKVDLQEPHVRNIVDEIGVTINDLLGIKNGKSSNLLKRRRGKM